MRTEKFKKCVSESFIIGLILSFVSYLSNLLQNSHLFVLKNKVLNWYNNISNTNPLNLLHTTYISNLWYNSFFYKAMIFVIRKVSFHIPKSSFKFKPIYIGFFMALIFLVPNGLWADAFWIPLFYSLVLLYVSRNISERRGTVFLLINLTLGIFMLLIRVVMPFSSVSTLIYLIIGIDFFFLISFSVSNFSDLEDVLKILFTASVLLCGITIIENIYTDGPVSATFYTNLNLGEVLITVFPFVFAYATEFRSKKKKAFYGGMIFILFLNAISMTQSKAAFIGFLIELLVLFIAYPKYFPFTVLLLPLGLRTVMENFRQTWINQTSHGFSIIDIIKFFKNIWDNGFGVSSKQIMNLYDMSNLKNSFESSSLMLSYINISPVYINFIIEVGAFFLLVFLLYILKLAHSSLIMLFTSEKKYHKFFAAGLATLVGISVSSFFDTSLFYPKMLLTYWGMLGILRAVRIMSLGVYE